MTDSYDVGYLDGEVVGYERGLSDGLNYDGYGPPTREDDAWFQHHVVSKGYPKLRREPKQMDGQARLEVLDKQTGEWSIFALTDEGPERLDG